MTSQPPSTVFDDAPRFQRYARLVLIAVLIGLGAFTLRGFIAALVWAAIIAVAIGPMYRRAALRWPPGKHNLVLPLLFTTVIALLFLLPFILLGIQAARDAHDVVAFTTDAMQSGLQEPAWVAHLPFGASAVDTWWKANLAQADSLAEFLHHAAKTTVALSSREVGIAITHRVVTFFFTIITLFFLLRSGSTIAAEMRIASGKLFGPRGEAIGQQIVASIHGTVDGLVLVGLGEGVLLGIAFWLGGVPHPTLLGALAAIAAMIPFVVIVMLAGVGLVLVAQGAVGMAIAVVAFGLVMNSIADHFVRPGLIGGATKLPFLWVLLAILGGVETWGLLGLFVGPALMSALHLLWCEFVRPEALLDVKLRPKTISPVPIAGE